MTPQDGNPGRLDVEHVWLADEASQRLSWPALRGRHDDLRFEYTRARPIETDARNGDIAYELDYADAAHFTRAFRRWTKGTPSEFRAGLREP